MSEMFFTPADLVQFSAEKMKKVNLYESKHLFCDVYCLEPGQMQKEHTHANNDKIYFVLSGVCQITIGEEKRALQPGQLAIAPAGVVHGVVNESQERATLLVVMAPHPNF